MLNLTHFTLKEGDRRGREEKQKGNGNSGNDDRGEKESGGKGSFCGARKPLGMQI